MKIKVGYLYHIKDEFFNVVNDNSLMANHEKGKQRPTYFVIKDEKILWFIPLSSKVDKYKKIIDDKLKKYGVCKTIAIKKVAGKHVAILYQNAFPTLEKYIDHVHVINGLPVKVNEPLTKEISTNFKDLLIMKQRGINLFFTDIDKIKRIMLEEVNCKL